MAIRYAIATGNWSNPAIWNGGLGVPGAGDVVHPEQYAVTLDQDITVAELRNDRSGGTVGGYFVTTAARTITADLYPYSTTPLLYMQLPGVGTMTFNGNLYQPLVNSGRCLYNSTGTVSLVVNGNVVGRGTATSAHTIYNDGPIFGDVTINGSVSSGASYSVYVSAGAARTYIVTGDCSGFAVIGTASAHSMTINRIVGNTSAGFYGVSIATTPGAVVNINGILEVANQAYLIAFAGTGGTYNVIGNLTAYSATPMSCSTTNATLNITGNLTASNTVNAYALSIAGVNTNVNIVGNVQAGTISGSQGLRMGDYQVGSLSITGNVTGSALNYGVYWYSQYHDKSCTITGTVNNPLGAALGSASYRSTINVGIIAAGASSGLSAMASAIGGSITIGGTSGVGYGLVGIGGAPTFVLTGNLVGTVYPGWYPLNVNMTGGSAVINGNITAGTGVTSCHGLVTAGSGYSVTVNGNVTAGQSGGSTNDQASANNGIYYSNANSTPIHMTINGDVTPNMALGATGVNCGVCIVNLQAGSLTVNGIVYASPNQTATTLFAGVFQYGSHNNGPHYIREVRGTNFPVGTETTYPRYAVYDVAVLAAHTNRYWVIGTVQIGAGGLWPIANGRVYLRTSDTNNIRLYDSPAGSLQSLGEGGANDCPANADVRSGTVFNFGSQTGTLAVPNPATVALGIATDNTVGSAAITQQAIADAVGPLIAAYGS